MKTFRKQLTLLFLLSTISLSAQLSEGGTPYSKANNIATNIPVLEMEAIPIDQIKKQDEINDQENIPWRFAWPFEVRVNMNSHGIWTENADGSSIWQLIISCPNANSINLLYDNFFIPEGGKFYIYAQDGSQTIGAYTKKNNKASGKFGTELVFDDQIILEYFEPADVKERARISIAQISHGYRSSQWNENRGVDDSGACQVNVNCSPEGDDWQDHKKSVAKIVVNGTDWCTGSLMNNTNEDCTPYFLTADHCLTGGLDAVTNPDAAGWVFYWNFERPGCANSGTIPNETTAGGTLVANDSPSDFALFELAENPSDDYDVFFNGYNATNTTGSGGTGIHHPSGDVKMIATHSITPATTGWGGGGTDHWTVNWDATTNGHSVTEGGSSGSPLYDSNARVIGQLHGGSSINCSDPANDPGVYGKISYSWFNNGATIPERRLHDWLDPVGGGSNTELDPKGAAPLVKFTSISSNVDEEAGTSPNACLPFQTIIVTVDISQIPSADATVSVAVSGSATSGSTADFEVNGPTNFVLNAGNMSQDISINIYNDGYLESVEDIILDLTLNANGGDAILSGSGNSHTVSIVSNDPDPTIGPLNVLDSEDFEAGIGNYTTTNAEGGDTWFVGDNTAATSASWAVPDNGTGQMIYANDDECNCLMSDVQLLSEVFDLSSASNAMLNFDLYYEGNTYQSIPESAEVLVSTDGTNFNLLSTLSGSGGWQSISLDLAAYIGNSTVSILFKYSDGGGWLYGIALDNITIESSGFMPIEETDGLANEQYLGPFGTVHYTDPTTGNLIASIQNAGAHDFGCTSVSVDRAGLTGVGYSAPIAFNDSNTSNYAAAKTIEVIPEFNNASADIIVTMYYTDDEMNTYLAATGNTLNNVSMHKVTGAQIQDVTPANASSYTIESLLSSYSDFDGDHSFTASFDTGFSGFGIGKTSSCGDLSNTNDSGAGSLRERISCAANGDVIILDEFLAPGAITVSSGPLVFDKDLTLIANNSGMSLNVIGMDICVHVMPGNNVQFENFDINFDETTTDKITLLSEGELELVKVNIEK